LTEVIKLLENDAWAA